MEKQEITPEEIKTPQEEVVKVAEKPKSGEKTLNIVLLVILLLLLVVAACFVIKNNFLSSNQNSAKDKTSISTEKDCKCEKCVEKECPVLKDGECKCPTLSATNPGWAIISVPELKVSIETPPSEYIKNIFQTTELISSWSFKYTKDTMYSSNGLGTYLGTIDGQFSPRQDTLGDIACGGNGCANLSHIGIRVHNNGNKTLTEIFNTYKETLGQEDEGYRLKGTLTTKWGVPAYEYSVDFIGGTEAGYLLVNNGLTYKIVYYIASQPSVVRTHVNTMLDSIKFN